MKILLEKEEVQSSKFECPKAVVFKLWVATHCWNFVSAGVNVSELAQTAPGPCAICRDKGNLKGSPFFARASLWNLGTTALKNERSSTSQIFGWRAQSLCR
ncbi:hypothetical protein T4E_2742 [Trichinella pseudospiralis]|uniref:Uncharacterized protein n=1 Tax=Trichinella pseudospiralis TaxID=6337 RepID=A0A0V0XHG9_TRIPS|nr:hypothetical protein T4E_2742 [Trichinella pseudospiralis]